MILHIGYYNTEIDAAIAYDEEAHKFFGYKARLNFPYVKEAKESKLSAILDKVRAVAIVPMILIMINNL